MAEIANAHYTPPTRPAVGGRLISSYDPSRRRLKLGLAVLAAVTLAILAGIRAFDLRSQRQQLLSAGDRRATNLAVVLSGYLGQTFAAVDASLRQLALHSRRIGGAAAPQSEWLPALVSARAALPAVGSVSVLDSNGVIRHSTQPLIIGQSRRDQYVFRQLAADSTDELVADSPFRALVRERPYLIPLGRRLSRPDGSFDGAIVATFLPSELREVFRSADVGNGGMVTVFHRNGFVIFREPSSGPDPIGQPAARQPLFEAARLSNEQDVFRGPALPDGRMLRTAFRSPVDRDFIVAVSLGEDELLNEWRRNAAIAAAVVLLLALALTALLVLTYRDIDTRISAGEALSRSQRLESIGRLTGGIAHDFNNLLTVILGNVTLIKDHIGPSTPAATRESVGQIERAASRGTVLIRQLLAFARRQPLQPRTIDLEALIHDAKPMLDRVLGEDIMLTVGRAAERRAFLTNVDPVGAESALLNLCINARDAMPGGGTIAIELSALTVGAQNGANKRDVDAGAYVVVSVSDTGNGIPPEHLAHLFEPFFTTKEASRGTGLGLSTVYGFMQQSGGHVKVFSDVGRGTVVRLYFPEAFGPVAVAPPQRPVETQTGNGEVILVVEDEPELLVLAARFLEDLGYRVLRASNGAAAIDAASREPRIDLLLADIVMPGGMSGRRLARELRAQRPGLRVVYMSGYSEELTAAEGVKTTDAEILPKPYDRSMLSGAVQRALRSIDRLCAADASVPATLTASSAGPAPRSVDARASDPSPG
jgi:signal transduction histidine kinase/DNA-binding NarL/FixJ family response regulator